MPSRTIRPVFALAALLLALPVCAGQVYQWKDAQGVTHFADAPPPDRQGYHSRELEGAPPPEPAAAVPAEDPACATARRNLEHLKGDRPVGLDANGDGQLDKEMSAEERAQQVRLTEETLAARCAGLNAGI